VHGNGHEVKLAPRRTPRSAPSSPDLTPNSKKVNPAAVSQPPILALIGGALSANPCTRSNRCRGQQNIRSDAQVRTQELLQGSVCSRVGLSDRPHFDFSSAFPNGCAASLAIRCMPPVEIERTWLARREESLGVGATRPKGEGAERSHAGRTRGAFSQ
jgi:hypothetical protein